MRAQSVRSSNLPSQFCEQRAAGPADAKAAVLRRTSQRRHGTQGFSVAEAVIAVAIISLTLGAMMTLNGHQLRMVKISRDMNAATLYQQERVEQLRQTRWPNLTDGAFISGTYMVKRPQSEMALNQISESITISAYPAPVAGSKALTVSQASGGSPTVDSTNNGYALGNERLVKVEMHLAWKGADGRAKNRTTTTLISNSGVTRSNLPALGPIAGGAWDSFSTPPPTGGGGGSSGGDSGGDSGDSGSGTGDTSGGTGGSGSNGNGNNGNGNNGNSGNGNNGNNGKGKGNTGGGSGQN